MGTTTTTLALLYVTALVSAVYVPSTQHILSSNTEPSTILRRITASAGHEWDIQAVLDAAEVCHHDFSHSWY